MQLTVTIDDATAARLEAMAANRGYPDVRRLAKDLLESHAIEEELRASPELEKMIQEGYASGISSESPEQVVARLRARVLAHRSQ